MKQRIVRGAAAVRPRVLRKSTLFSALAALTCLALAAEPVADAGASSANLPAVTAQAKVRVTQRVDNAQRTVIKGQTIPALRNASDLGRVSADSAMDHLLLVLQASPEQDHALKSLVDQQQDRNNPNFHKWLTPDEFGAHFGVADADIAQVTNWLQSQGLTVEQVTPGKRLIEFSGSVGQVEAAFQTQMHQYSVAGQTHIANSADISVPTALRPVIVGVPTLHDFFKTTGAAKNARKASVPVDPLTGKIGLANASSVSFVTPDFTNPGSGKHYFGAADFAVVYNTTPLLQAGYDGTGVSIGIIGRTDLHLADIQMYRYMFGLKSNDPTFTYVGENPGIIGGDDGESYLDVEVSGGAAPGASVNFITSAPTLTVDGVDLSAMYAVQHNATDIISESYGQCEANFGDAQAQFYADLWGQAAAQGQSVFVSSGDNGPAGCDSASSSYAHDGYAVSLLASSPYNVAVGGTGFKEPSGDNSFWLPTASVTNAPPFLSALKYIPEVPWNEAKGTSGTVSGTGTAWTGSGLWSGSGGISAYFQTPSWQRGFNVPTDDPAYSGNPTTSPASPFVPGPHRYMPDVALNAAGDSDATVYCAEGVCQLSSTGAFASIGLVSGTSVAAPSMAGVQALVNQVNGGRQGQPNMFYYALADAQHTASLTCSSESPDPDCAFHDIDTGNTLVCATSGTCSTTSTNKIGWTAAAGYDLATGLGSPNVAKLAAHWQDVVFNSSAITLALSQTSFTHGDSVTATGSVAPGSGTGVPTGQVAFLVSSGAVTNPIDPDTGGYLNQVALATLDAGGNYAVDLTALPAGTYYVTARYSGDTTYASSISLPVRVTVTSEGSSVVIEPQFVSNDCSVFQPQTTFTYGSYIWTDVIVSGGSGQGVPTGSVSITDGGNALLTSSLNADGVAHFLSGVIASCLSGYTFADSAPLTGGTHTIGATYSGDGSFGSMAATPVTVTITQATLSGALATGSTYIAAGDPVQLNFTINGLSGAGPGFASPTGTVTFTDSTSGNTLGTATLAPTSTYGGVAVLTTTGITGATGAHSIVASWLGDTNYAAINSAAKTVTIQTGTATSVAVTSSGNPIAVGGRPTFTATLTPATPTSGTVSFYDSGVLLGTGTVGATHTATYRPAASVNLPAGVHAITAIYGGTTTYNASTSSVFAQTFTKAATTLQLTAKNRGAQGELFTLSGVLGFTAAPMPNVSGTLTFYDGNNAIGSAPFTVITSAAGGYGIYQSQILAPLAVGVHTITAQFNDPNYSAPVSNTQTVTVVAAPTLSSAFNASSVMQGATATLIFSVSNPNATASVSGLGFSDTLSSAPGGIAVAATPNVQNTCGGTVSADAGSQAIQVAGLTLAAGASCTISVDVTGTAVGAATSSTSALTSADAGTGSASNAGINVTATPASLALSIDDHADYAAYGQTLTYTVTLTNSGGTAANASIDETLPGADFDVDNAQWTCVASTGGTCAASGTGAISDASLVVPANGSLTWTITVPILADAPDDSAVNSVSVTVADDANSPYSAADSDTLVIFRDGFDGDPASAPAGVTH